MLSIVVPVLNEAAVLPTLFESLAPIRARGAEVLIVDGGSRDNSMAVAQAGADVVISAPQGRAAQMNAGAAAAHGDTLLFLHADTYLPVDTLDAIKRARNNGARWGYFGLDIRSRHPMLRVVARMATWRSRVSRIATGDQAIFVECGLYDECGGFPDLPLMEDIALSRRLRSVSEPTCLRSCVSTSARRWESKGVIRTVVLMWWLRLLYRLGVPAEWLASQYVDVRTASQ